MRWRSHYYPHVTDLFCSTSNQPSKWRTRATTAITREEPWDRMIFRVQPLAQSHFHHFHQTLLQPDRSDRNIQERSISETVCGKFEAPNGIPSPDAGAKIGIHFRVSFDPDTLRAKHLPKTWSHVYHLQHLLFTSKVVQWSNLIQSDPIWSNGRWCDWDPRTEMTLPAAQGQDGADM